MRRGHIVALVSGALTAGLAAGSLLVPSGGVADAQTECPPATTTTTTPGTAPFRDDQFDGSALQSFWREVDPIGNGTVSVSGGELRLALPQGGVVNHDNWPKSAWPVNRTLRVVQPVGAGDWTVETRIMNTDRDAGRFAGFLIESDANHFIRSDWDGNGTTVKLYVATWNGTAPFSPKFNADVTTAAVQWQRIRKQGTTYTVSTSLNGSSWTQRASFTWTPPPRLVGLNVGNSVGLPAYTARFDYLVARPG